MSHVTIGIQKEDNIRLTLYGKVGDDNWHLLSMSVGEILVDFPRVTLVRMDALISALKVLRHEMSQGNQGSVLVPGSYPIDEAIVTEVKPVEAVPILMDRPCLIEGCGDKCLIGSWHCPRHSSQPF